jgi:hypothetical protein
VLSLEQFVLCKIAEEATEVGKRALKQQQFGAHQHEDGYAPNRERLASEVTDMLGWLTIAAHIGVLPEHYAGVNVYHRYRTKRPELLRVLKIAVDQGQVSTDALDFINSSEQLPD